MKAPTTLRVRAGLDKNWLNVGSTMLLPCVPDFQDIPDQHGTDLLRQAKASFLGPRTCLNTSFMVVKTAAAFSCEEVKHFRVRSLINAQNFNAFTE